METNRQADHLQLIQGGNPIQTNDKLIDQVASQDATSIDHKATRIKEWNKRLENLFARQRV